MKLHSVKYQRDFSPSRVRNWFRTGPAWTFCKRVLLKQAIRLMKSSVGKKAWRKVCTDAYKTLQGIVKLNGINSFHLQSRGCALHSPSSPKQLGQKKPLLLLAWLSVEAEFDSQSFSFS